MCEGGEELLYGRILFHGEINGTNSNEFICGNEWTGSYYYHELFCIAEGINKVSVYINGIRCYQTLQVFFYIMRM